jgi:probable HAF family extracellular repeat protein
MKNILTSIAASVLLASVATAQSSHHGYKVTDLGPVGRPFSSPFSQATSLNNRVLIGGLAALPDGTQHAVLWYGGRVTDIGTPGLGGPNSGAFGVNERGQVLIGAETSTKDPNNENFCGYGTGLQCLGAVWQDSVMTPLPTLGGTNASVGGINNRGQVAGWAETAGPPDKDCPPGVAVNGTGPQVLDYEAVIWGPKPDQIRELRPFPGDTVGMALGINDNGQAVGTSGLCSNTVLPGFASGPHAVLWDRDGSVQDLGSLGGTSNPHLLGVGNIAFSINNRGEVAGTSALPGSTTHHPFLWTKDTGMRDLGVLDGDAVGAGLAINNRGDVVGASIGEKPRAVLWRDGEKSDLNTLIRGDSPFLKLLTAFGINDGGQIVGFGLTKAGDLHGFLANPAGNGDH